MLIQPNTEPGRRFYAAADSHVAAFRERYAKHDRDATMPVQNFDDLKASGMVAAFVPEELGGFGLASILDWIAGMSRLGSGDGSTAIALNMHLSVSRGIAGAWEAARRGGNDAAADALERRLRAIAAGDLIICATATERGTDNLRPRTTATPVDGGWRVSGTKVFVTMSPIADEVTFNLRVPGDGGDRIGFATIPLDTPGIEPQDDWDALGMRASGSQSIVFNNCFVPDGGIQIAGPWGQWNPGLLMGRTIGNITLLGPFVGIAEHAMELALADAHKQTRVKLDGPIAQAPGVQTRVGELVVRVHAAAGVLAWTATRLDELLAGLSGGPTLEQGHQIMSEYQAAKWVVHENTIAAVSLAMDIAGGGGFMTANALSRLYRDVRAGPFMQPFAATEARGYVGQVALGMPPEG
jgi:L-evernosamine nitrososynthase